MALHLAARFHAFIHGLGKPRDVRQTQHLYYEVAELFAQHGIDDEERRDAFIIDLAEEIAAALGLPPGSASKQAATSLIRDIFDYEGLLALPHIDWKRSYSISEHWAFREALNEQWRLVEDFQSTRALLKDTLIECLSPVYAACLSPKEELSPNKGITFRTDLLGSVPDIATVVEAMIAAMFDDVVMETPLFGRLRNRFDRNLILASGGDPDAPRRFTGKTTFPSASRIADPSMLVETYLRGTPIPKFLRQEIDVSIPDKVRVEHCHIIGGTGHGKTQLLQRMVLSDLRGMAGEKQSLVVVDSQGDLIRKVSSLALFDPDTPGSLAERLILIDPTDIEHPPALNLFDPGVDRLARYTPREREVAFNSLVDIYGRFFGALLGSELTARQGAVFRYLARLMLTIEEATIHTLIELMDDPRPFKEHTRKLDPTARRFFEKEFTRPAFNATRQQIKQRLYAVLSIPTFDRLFSAPRSKINFFDELNAGAIVLVSTAKDVLKADGAGIFGRFILSLIEHAIMERATLAETERTPTYLYVDEAQDYFDETVETLLVQGRKYRFGLILAHQNLAQLDVRLRAILMGNTTVKFAGGITSSDAKALAPDMRTSKVNLLSLRKDAGGAAFALFIRNHTPHAITVTIPFGLLEEQPTLSREQWTALVEQNRARVCYKSAAEPTQGASTQTPDTSNAELRAHTETQRRLAELAKDHGFGAEIEYALPDGKRIDLALFGHYQSIAIEVSVTNREAYELANVEKALDAGFAHVWMVVDDAEHRERIAAHVRRSLTPARLSRVTFGFYDDATGWLGKFASAQKDYDSIAGYAVEAEMAPPGSPQDHAFRRERLRHALEITSRSS